MLILVVLRNPHGTDGLCNNCKKIDSQGMIELLLRMTELKRMKISLLSNQLTMCDMRLRAICVMCDMRFK